MINNGLEKKLIGLVKFIGAFKKMIEISLGVFKSLCFHLFMNKCIFETIHFHPYTLKGTRFLKQCALKVSILKQFSYV